MEGINGTNPVEADQMHESGTEGINVAVEVDQMPDKHESGAEGIFIVCNRFLDGVRQIYKCLTSDSCGSGQMKLGMHMATCILKVQECRGGDPWENARLDIQY